MMTTKEIYDYALRDWNGDPIRAAFAVAGDLRRNDLSNAPQRAQALEDLLREAVVRGYAMRDEPVPEKIVLDTPYSDAELADPNFWPDWMRKHAMEVAYELFALRKLNDRSGAITSLRQGGELLDELSYKVMRLLATVRQKSDATKVIDKP